MKKLISLIAAVLLCMLCFVACNSEPATSTPDESIPTTTTVAADPTTTVGGESDPTDPTESGEVTDPTTVGGETDPTTGKPTDAPTAAPDNGTTANTTKKPDTTKKTTTTTAPKATTADWMKNYTSKQIINDNTFQNGFNIACNEKPGTTVHCGNWNPTDSSKKSVWQLSQWGTFNSYVDRSGMQCLWEDRLNTPNNILTNGINRVEYVPERKSLILTMNTYDYFNGHGHTDNSSWPHLLIEQSIISRDTFFNLDDEDQLYYSLAADKMILELDLRLTNFSHEPLEGINACQLVSFYYVTSQRDSGFIWFGMGLFDDRGYDQSPGPNDNRFMMDYGTGNYMYGIPQADTYNNTLETGRYDFFNADFSAVEASDTWMHISMDIKPYLLDMASKTMKGSEYNIYKNTKELKDLFISGLNLGYEVHGTYDVTFEIANYSLTGYVKK